jgi:hypothetical protein
MRNGKNAIHLALLLGVIGTLTAGNSAVKFFKVLDHAGYTYTVSLPANNKFSTANDVLLDLNAKCGATSIAGLVRIVPSAGGTIRQAWLNPGGGVNFPIVKGEGYLVQLAANATPCQWAIIGSHDDTLEIHFAQQSQPYKSYLVAIPFHSTAHNASELISTIPNCISITRIVPSTGGTIRQAWLSPGGGVNFPVTTGEAYIVDTNADSTWRPTHY